MRKHSLSRRFSVFLFATLLSHPAALLAAAHAHYGTPTVDGIEGVGEWTGADAGSDTLVLPAALGGGSSTVTFYVMSDETFVYVAVRVPVAESPDFPDLIGLAVRARTWVLDPCAPPVFIDEFQLISTDNSALTFDGFWTSCEDGAEEDSSDSGFDNTSGTWAISLSSHFLEMAQPLNAGDDAHDLNVAPLSFLWVQLLAGGQAGKDSGEFANISIRLFLANEGSIFFADFETGDQSEWPDQ